jgi:hypothetical protein
MNLLEALIQIVKVIDIKKETDFYLNNVNS